jgi:hypothetical protein
VLLGGFGIIATVAPLFIMWLYNSPPVRRTPLKASLAGLKYSRFSCFIFVYHCASIMM